MLDTPISTKVAIAQLGARKHYLEPVLLEQWGLLETLYTDLYGGKFPFSMLLGRENFQLAHAAIDKITARYDCRLNPEKVVHFPLFGYEYNRKLAKAKVEDLSDIYRWAGEKICRLILGRGIGTANTIYGFNSACLELFEFYQPRGVYCILDQTIAELSLMLRLLLAEEDKWPGWMKEPFTVNDADWQLVAREQQEQDLADRIICGSEFVKDSLVARGVSPDKISVVSIGRRQESTQPDPLEYPPDRQRNDRLKILFAGHVDLRKGIPYLLTALEHLKDKIPFVCKIAGSLGIGREIVDRYSDICDFLGRVPRSHMRELYAWADIFVLPSICEGSAVVVYEALLNGVPAIVTPNTGSIVRDGIDGYVVPIRDATAIADRLVRVYENKGEFFSIEHTRSYALTVNMESQELLKKQVAFNLYR